MRLVADKNIPFLKGVLESYFEVEYLSGKDITSDVVRNADAMLIRTRTICNSALLSGSKVKFIGSATIGFDHIDTNYCDNNKIVWANAPGCNSAGVQQWVATALIHWAELNSKSLSGLTIGVVGVGNVGKKVVDVAKMFGMNVLCCDPPRKRSEELDSFVDLETILKNSDIITFHVPLNHDGADKTFHMLNSDSLSLCKPDVYILNSSRGEVVDTNGLLSFLNSKPKTQAALDVWENEPNVSTELMHRTIIATPHIAGYSLEGKVMGTKMIVESLSRFFGLGIDSWFPTPNPLDEKVVLDKVDNIFTAIKSTYNIVGDDLRNANADFESLRNNYNYRRDFSGHAVNQSCNLLEDLKRIGFSVRME
ncbi:MAG: 4-phosphoerythronate dehydrogenase [Bacteroidales bacterium]